MAAQLNADSLYLMHLMSCALRGEAPQALPADATWDAVYNLALSNSVTTTCAFAAAKAPGIDAAEAKRWRDEVYKNAVRFAVFADEREAIFAQMDAAGLAHMPVKGVVTAEVYPRPEMRWMCDNDFLFGHDLGNGRTRVADHDDSLAMRRIMEARGYDVEEFEESNADAYHKEPILNFEPHRLLAVHETEWWSYYDDQWPRHHHVEGAAGNAYEMAKEDSYLYHIAHMSKHFTHAGHGVRGLADEWAFLNSGTEPMDRAYLQAELAKLNMADFEASLQRVAESAISDDACGRALSGDADALALEVADMLAYMLGSGTYGNSENFALHAVQADMAEHGRVGGRIRYFARRLFPPTDTLKHTYPILQRAPWLRPAVDLYRFTIRPFQQRAKLRTELSAVMGKAGENTPGTNK
jgi:hypothetical protein